MSAEPGEALSLKPFAKGVRATAVARVSVREIMGWGPLPSTHKARWRAPD